MNICVLTSLHVQLTDNMKYTQQYWLLQRTPYMAPKQKKSLTIP
jgi:hypothetical protein